MHLFQHFKAGFIIFWIAPSAGVSLLSFVAFTATSALAVASVNGMLTLLSSLNLPMSHSAFRVAQRALG